MLEVNILAKALRNQKGILIHSLKRNEKVLT